MARKVWYKFYVGAVIKDENGEMKVAGGNMELVAQVKSPGLACIIHQKLKEVYPESRFVIECK